MQCSERRASVLRRARRPRHLRARLGGARLRREAAGRVAQHRRLCRTPWRATLLRPVPLLAIRECGRCRRSVPGERPVEGRGMSSPTLWSVRLRRQARRLVLDLFGAREVRTLTPLFTPTDPNRGRLRPTCLAKDPPKSASAGDIRARRIPIGLLGAEYGLRDGPDL